MIYGIGVDCTKIERFVQWEHYSKERLLKVFTPFEIAECFNKEATPHIPSFLASRFAAKEAFYKALCPYLFQHHPSSILPSFAHCRTSVGITKQKEGIPFLSVDWKNLEKKCNVIFPSITSHLSLTHEKEMAIAFVILSS